MARLLFVAPFIAALGVALYFLYFKSPPAVPEMDLEAWWGPLDLKTKADDSIKPFKIKFKEVMIQNLRDSIKNFRTPTPPLDGIAFEYGFNSHQIDSWLKYWSQEYPFAERQKYLNQYQQYKTNIQGLNIHFVSVRPEVPNGVETVPVLLLHGWPGSVREFYDSIPYLTAVQEVRDYALELVIPSLPGYGFSDAAVRPGLGAAEIAVVMRNLMQRLGFKKFYVHGGDWGSIIGSIMATVFPDEVLGYHTNMVFSMAPTPTIVTAIAQFYPSLFFSEEEISRMYPLKTHHEFIIEESGYMHIQSTKPDTIGVALSDSPAGLLAYILEKFSTWTDRAYRKDPTGGLLNYFTKEQLIDNLMFYWTTGSITTSMRLYSETFNKRHFEYYFDRIPTKVPTWVVQQKQELAYLPPFLIKLKYPNLVNASMNPEGGHFFALQLPKVFSEDLVKAIGEFRKLNKVEKTEL